VNAALLLRRWNALDAMAAGLVPQSWYTPSPETEKITSLKPPMVPPLKAISSIFHPWSRA